MHDSELSILETLELPRGFEIDLEEGWRKLIARQFGGDPGRGFAELIQNFLDSYDSAVPWEQRRAEIVTGPRSISITDWGEGLSRARLRLLVTMGGTDKQFDDSKIGTFGIGFFSVFNPRLATQRVVVTTRCEGHGAEVAFDVDEPQQRPAVSAQRLDAVPAFGTRVAVEFESSESTARCLAAAKQALKYYPCLVTIDGERFESVWEAARKRKARFFRRGAIEGFVQRTSVNLPNARLLCKFEHVLHGSPGYLVHGARAMHHDLRDYQSRGTPYVPHTEIVVNSNKLTTTISRDGLIVNARYFDVLDALSEALETELRVELGRVQENQDEYARLVVANQFALAQRLRRYLEEKTGRAPPGRGEAPGLPSAPPPLATLVERDLAEAKVYRASGRKERLSLLDLARMKNRDLPLFYAPRQSNVRWLGGEFQHDFVVLPPRQQAGGGAPDLYDELFGVLFDQDAVNLDTIEGNQEKIAALVERGVVSPDVLEPDARAVSSLELQPEERELQEELNALLRHEAVLTAVSRNLCLTADTIEATFYRVESERVDVPSGLFDSAGEVINATGRSKGNGRGRDGPRRVYLGLRRGHPFVEHLKASTNAHRAYFALTFLAHELARSQKALVPHTPYTHFIKNSLCHDMRRGLLVSITADA